MKKLIDFQSSSMVERIQRHANNEYNGNFNKAVRDLVCKSLPLTKDEPKVRRLDLESKQSIMDGLKYGE